MGRPAELADRAQFGQPVAGVGKDAAVARPARGVAADVGDARYAAFGELQDLVARASAGRVEHDSVEPAQRVGAQGIAEQVAVNGVDRPTRQRRSRTARQVSVARRFGRQNPRGTGKRVGVVFSGANLDTSVLRRILNREL